MSLVAARCSTIKTLGWPISGIQNQKKAHKLAYHCYAIEYSLIVARSSIDSIIFTISRAILDVLFEDKLSYILYFI